MKIYQIDAFTSDLFGGNPAAVIPLQEWLPDDMMQKIANENNLSETAFYIPLGDQFYIRWMTPTMEVDLCGHATLAAAYVLFTQEGYKHDAIVFNSKSGKLHVTKDGEKLTMDFPADSIEKTLPLPALAEACRIVPMEIWKGKSDYMLVFENQQQIETMTPDLNALANVPCRGVIVTAPGDQVDFVSRFFSPRSGIDEDPVTGSAHTTLAPYWASRLQKNKLEAMQLSSRRGHIWCEVADERIKISGHATLYLRGQIFL